MKAFLAEREWAQFHDPKNLAMAAGSVFFDRIVVDFLEAAGAKNYPVAASLGRSDGQQDGDRMD